MTRSDRLAAGLLALLFAFGLLRASSLAWVCDDTFISLRYAQNLLAGHGLVYNPGEFVEGYTNLLWTLLLAALLKVGIDPLRAAELPGIAAYLWLALTLCSWSLNRVRSSGLPFLPVASGFVLVSEDFQVWATGGLETMLFTALAVQALLLTRGPTQTAGRAVSAGALLGLTVLTRPDGLLFAAAGVLSWWVPASRLAAAPRVRLALLTLLPVLLVLGMWVPWKLATYGDLFPTAFYSKSASKPFLSQGFVYAGLYLVRNWVLLVALLAAALLWLRREAAEPTAAGWDERFFLACGLLYAGYVVYVGGDFMYARRLIPAVPFFLLALESRLARWPRAVPRRRLALAVVIASALPLPIFDGTSRIQNIGDERRFYPAAVLEQRRQQAAAVSAALGESPARLAFEGGMCSFGYYSGLPYLVEITGLTQYSLAKLPLEERGFIGHEKVADDKWLRENDIHMLVSQDLPPLKPEPGVLKIDQIYFGDLARARISVYSDPVMDPLRGRPDVHFTPIERAIRFSAKQMQSASRADAEAIYRELRRYYLDAAGERGAHWDHELRAILDAK